MKLINKYVKVGSILLLSLLMLACKKSFLEVQPRGVLGDKQMASPQGVREALISAYSDLDGQFDPNEGAWYYQQPDNWLFGSVAGGEAHKGSDPGDQSNAMSIARFEGSASNPYFHSKWRWLYDGVARCNLVLRLAAKVDLEEDEKGNIIAQAHFLRGFYYFEAKKMWNSVPWVDTSVTYAAGNYQIPNDEDIFPKIEEEFKYAYDNLPETQEDIGRANKWAAGAFLAKTYLFEGKYNDALPLLTDIINKGNTADGTAYALQSQFNWNFNALHQNSSESVFAIQASLHDGSEGFHGNHFDMLNYPYGNGAVTGCCGFFQPSIELVNAYRTDDNGLPLLDGSLDSPEYDLANNAVKNDMGLSSSDAFTPDNGNLDPRVDWTVGRRGIPYLDWGDMPGKDWIRNQASAGPYSPKKNVFKKSDVGAAGDNSTTSWAPLNSINYSIIRFAQVLLWAAECEIKADNGDPAKAEEYVNRVRSRAANPDGFVRDDNGDPAATYNISTYPNGWFSSHPDKAIKAVHIEELLELAMEGHRFFDLVRWGIADKVINHYFDYEGQFTDDIKGAQFSAKNKYFPIPQQEIDLSNGTLKQNEGYR